VSLRLLGSAQVSDATNDEFHRGRAAVDWRPQGAGEREPARNIPELVSALYEEAPAPLRTQLLECLVRPLGPLALVAIARGAFRHLLYRLRRDAVPISPRDTSRVTPEQVLELTRYVEQCNPDALLRIGALIADRPIGAVTMSGAALMIALGLNHSETLQGRSLGEPRR
jgi:hypothetical protein